MIADICVGKCGHFAVKQEITTQMPHCGQIYNQIVDLTIYFSRNLKEKDMLSHFGHYFTLCMVVTCVDILLGL